MVSKTFDTIVVCIMDSVGGIDIFCPSIFEMFKSSKFKSCVGIGLNIAKSIVEDHGGIITVKNVDGVAMFEVVFKKSKR